MKFTTEMKNRLIRTLIICLLGVVVGAAIGWQQVKEDMKTGKPTQVATVSGAKLGGPFNLVNQDGVAVTEKAYEGTYKLVYFGFTYCPMICPTELQKITNAMNALPPEALEKVQPLFITTDPARDTPAVMKEYIASFHPKIIGLTGTQEQIDSVIAQYKVFAKKVQDDSMTEYSMDHSTFSYFMAPDGSLLTIYRADDAPEAMAKDMAEKVKAGI